MVMQEKELEERDAAVEKEMERQGVTTTQKHQQSYFGFDEKYQVFLPDNVSFIEHQVLNEGQRKVYLDNLNREVAIKKVTGDAHMKLQSGTDKHRLLEAAIVGWNLVDAEGKSITFSKGSPGSTLMQFLDKANPHIVDIIEKDIRRHNPWLMAEMSSDDIRKQIEELEEMLTVKVAEEQGKGN